MRESASVVIIGSGVAGSFLANALAAQGFPGILVLEAGPTIPMADPAWWFRHVARGGGTSNTPYAACYDAAGDVTGGAAIRAARVAPAAFQLYGNLSAIPQYDNRVTSAPGTNRFGLPRTAIATPAPLYDPDSARMYQNLMNDCLATMGCTAVASGTYPQRGDHAACTTRMASDPARGVVNRDLQVFGTDNVFVVSNSSLPTLPAANPTLTLVALAYKLLGDPQSALSQLVK